MSPANVELVRRSIETFNGGHFATMLERYYDPAVEWHATDEFPDRDVYRGHAELTQFLEAFWDNFDPLWVEADEYLDAGERVVVLGSLCGRGRASDLDVKTERGWVMTLRDAKVTRVDTYRDHEQARRAAGV
jgi:ketosteroid isomerase-like protein